jgi:hypothetical protein
MPMKAQANPGFALGGDVGDWVNFFLNPLFFSQKKTVSGHFYPLII